VRAAYVRARSRSGWKEFEAGSTADPMLADLKNKLAEGKAQVLKGIEFVKSKGPEYMTSTGAGSWIRPSPC
jgi:hypothetical protein